MTETPSIRLFDYPVCSTAATESCPKPTEQNRFRNDWLFSYQPTPGTVLFAGYGSTSAEPANLRFRQLSRLTDGFFLKFSYLFRL